MSDWRHEAACLDEDPELFWPIGTSGPAVQQAEEAKAVCRRCEVQETCLRWALNKHQDFGIWGGLDEEERVVLRRREQRMRRGESSGPIVTVPVGPYKALLQAQIDRGVSVTQLAARCGISQDTVGIILNETRPTVRDLTADKITTGLGPVTVQ